MRRQFLALVCLGLGWLGLPGCGSKGEGTVTGEVVYKGQPITEGEVHFFDKEKGFAAKATLDSAGRFTFGQPLAVGTYGIYVTPVTGAPPDPRKGSPAKATSLIPQKSRDLVTSGLSKEVKQGNNDFKLDLTD